MFKKATENGIEYMTSDILPVKNVFTTRSGGVSEGDYSSLNIGSNRGDAPENVRENYRRLCALFNAGENDACVTNQVHGCGVKLVTSADRHECMGSVPYEADGIVTGEKNLPIMCFTADCVPVLMADKDKKAAAAVHCGWRSSSLDILSAAVKAMESRGAQRSRICAAIGPSIGSCCFETDLDVPQAIGTYLGMTEPELKDAGVVSLRNDGKYLVDLRLANRLRLISLGLMEENIDMSTDCTFCMPEKYYSHRYSAKRGLNRGSLANVIVLD